LSSRKLSNYEKETIINFNEAEHVATIFTYNKSWQNRLEKKLGLKPTMDNGFGGKEYQIEKRRIPMPQAPRKLSAETKRKYAENLRKVRQKRHLRSQTQAVALNRTKKNQNKGNSINQQPRPIERLGKCR